MTTKSNNSILFLGKKKDKYCTKAVDFIKRNFYDVSVYLGEWGDPLPEDISWWDGDYIISYLSRWVVPEYLIRKAKVAAINFHPASPDYPGIGCYNFALYEEANEYGVTCHYMANKVDTGKIIAVKRFPIFMSDDVASLILRTYDFQLVLFYEIMSKIIKNEPLPSSEEIWSKKPFTRKQFNQLGIINLSMTDEEVTRRVRATSYGLFKPTIEIAGHIFEIKPVK
jgi:methionyl-tRNA formyltransferase